jgi:hypothetical protein
MSHTPRDPERIGRILALLREAWQLVPDWRLNQLILNVTDIEQGYGPLFYLEDAEMEQRLASQIRKLKAMDLPKS